MSSSWDWIGQYADDAAESNDASRLRLCQFCLWAEGVPNTQPEAKLAFYEQGRELARQMREPWWQMFYEHWVIETLLHKLARPREALDRAARAVLEIRKPVYDAFPQRCALQLNLISCYMAIDPIGYQNQIRAAFVPLEKECAQWKDFRCYYAQQWGHFLSSVDDAGALDAAWRYLQLAQITDESWDLKCALCLLCVVLWKFDRENARGAIGEIALEAEELSREENHVDDIAMSQMWRAVAARWDSDQDAATALYERAWKTQKRAPAPRKDVHFAAMAFHQIGGETELELKICEREIRILRAHELTFGEVKRRFRKCELLRELGRNHRAEAKRLRERAQALPSREYWEGKLAEL